MEIANLSDILLWLSKLKFESPIIMMFGLIVMSLLPAVIMGVTCFVKVSVVMAALRSALGGSGIPTQAISSFLALVLSLRMLLPLAVEFENNLVSEPIKIGTDIETAGEVFIRIKTVLGDHLLHNADPRKRQSFILVKNPEANIEGCRIEKICHSEGENFLDLLCAFLISELAEAFEIAVALFIPFIVIDLVIASLLAGMGMIMVSPANIALPIKLAVFVIAEGWLNISSLIAKGYAH